MSALYQNGIVASNSQFEELISLITRTNPGANIALIEKAYHFAETAHSEQKRASGEPYIVHPLAAARTLAELRLDDATIAAALLHDVVDDTPFTTDDIQKEFGDEVAFLVDGVTKLGKIKYQGEERHVENLRKMFLAMAQDIRVVLIKLADRLHNMDTLSHVSPHKRRRIALETLEVYSPIASRLGMGDIKGRLDDLAFPYVYPEEYKTLRDTVTNLYEERALYLERIEPILRELLKKADIEPLEIQARAKHYYSLWQKLQRTNMDMSKIYDLVAMRIIARDVAACYATLGIIHKYWKPLPGRIKDYIALPKPNGYRSLHTTVFCEDGVITEFQIRTADMQQEAEYGIVAHWAYEEGGKPDHGVVTTRRLRWIKQLSEWQREIQGTDEFLDALKIDFFSERIFVFTPKGDVIELPDGATPLDFAFAIHSHIGEKASGARVNDKFVSLNTALHNGDVVEVITQKGKVPSQNLLDIAKTTAARSHIRKSLRAQGVEVRPKKEPTRIEIIVTVEDRVGLLKDLSAVLAKFGVNIVKIESAASEEHAGVVDIHIVGTVKEKQDLPRIIFRFKKIRGVLETKARFLS